MSNASLTSSFLLLLLFFPTLVPTLKGSHTFTYNSSGWEAKKIEEKDNWSTPLSTFSSLFHFLKLIKPPPPPPSIEKKTVQSHLEICVTLNSLQINKFECFLFFFCKVMEASCT